MSLLEENVKRRAEAVAEAANSKVVGMVPVTGLWLNESQGPNILALALRADGQIAPVYLLANRIHVGQPGTTLYPAK